MKVLNVTVILCTYNRSESLARALDSVLNSQIAEDVQWEVLVVDNNSHDMTRAVVEDRIRRHPGRVAYLFEPLQGKSHALNSGIRHARGDVLAFVDDDVEVDSAWLGQLVAPLKLDRWVGTGGRILPERGFVLPPWLDRNRRYGLAPLALFDLGPEARELKEAPFGTNMAFRKEMFAKYGEFRTDLGPQKGSEIRDEDTEFGSRLLAGGELLWYQPSAVVYHSIPPARAQMSYFLKWWSDKARAEVRQDPTHENSRWSIAGVPPILLRRLLRWTLQWLVTPGPADRFWCKIQVWRARGAAFEYYVRWRQGESCISATEQQCR